MGREVVVSKTLAFDPGRDDAIHMGLKVEDIQIRPMHHFCISSGSPLF